MKLKVHVTCADAEVGTTENGQPLLVVNLPNSDFLRLMADGQLTIGGSDHGLGSSMALVDITVGNARANIVLDLGDQETRALLSSWHDSGANVELRHNGRAVAVRHTPSVELQAEVKRLLELPCDAQHFLFCLLTMERKGLCAKLAATRRPGEERPKRRFLYSALLARIFHEVVVGSLVPRRVVIGI